MVNFTVYSEFEDLNGTNFHQMYYDVRDIPLFIKINRNDYVMSAAMIVHVDRHVWVNIYDCQENKFYIYDDNVKSGPFNVDDFQFVNQIRCAIYVKIRKVEFDSGNLNYDEVYHSKSLLCYNGNKVEISPLMFTCMTSSKRAEMLNDSLLHQKLIIKLIELAFQKTCTIFMGGSFFDGTLNPNDIDYTVEFDFFVYNSEKWKFDGENFYLPRTDVKILYLNDLIRALRKMVKEDYNFMDLRVHSWSLKSKFKLILVQICEITQHLNEKGEMVEQNVKLFDFLNSLLNLYYL